mgnify:CR=1 FL=1
MSAKKANEKMRIIIKAFDHRLLDEAVKKIVLVAKDSWAIVVGPIPLPTKIEKITLNRSTFVNKDAREQFEIRKHKRIFKIFTKLWYKEISVFIWEFNKIKGRLFKWRS